MSRWKRKLDTEEPERIDAASQPETSSSASFLGLLMLQTTFPRIPGDVGHEETFAFPEFSRVFLEGAVDLDGERCRQEVVRSALDLTQNSRVRAIVLECTNLPPYAGDIRKVTGLPVFDVCTMLNTAYASLYSRP